MSSTRTRPAVRADGSRGTARTLATTLGLALLVAATACSSSKSLQGAATPASTESAGTATTTSAAIADTVPEPTAITTTSELPSTTGSTTTSTLPIDPAVLRADGIGRFTLGDESGGVVDGLRAVLGAPVSDTYAEYPVAGGLGEYTTVEGETGFVAPMGRTTCWSMNFCAEFGGATHESMSFTGWTYQNDPGATLHTASGVTVRTRLSDAPTIVADEGGCYSAGSGTVEGIRLGLESSGDPFSSFDDAGNYVVGSPSPADVTVTWMETGHVPTFLYGDC